MKGGLCQSTWFGASR